MKLGGIKGQTTTSRSALRQDNDAPAAAIGESRALVTITPAVERHRDPRTNSRDAAFLAQLIAANTQVPQARERRRAAPEDAVHAYEAVLMARPRPAGRIVSRAT